MPTPDAGATSLTVTLDPLASVVIDGHWSLDGHVAGGDSGASGDFAVTVTDVVPEPGTGAVLALGWACLARGARRRRVNST